MSKKRLSVMERDAIGEILNISLGSSATAVSNMLDTKVDITTPTVQVIERCEFAFDDIKPAVGVEITYVEGITGQNVMLLKKSDVKIIVEMLMGMTFDDTEFELDEMNMSAICEVMNQMMGASATALSELLSKTVNISTPQSFEVTSEEEFKEKYFTDDERMAVVRFTLKIGDRLESEFLNLMTIELAKDLVKGFFPDGVPDEEEEAADAQPQAEAVQADAQPQAEAAQAVAQPQAEAAQADAQPQAEAAQPAVQPQAEAVQPQAPVQPQAEAAPMMQQAPVQSVMPPQAAYAAADPAVMEQMLKTMQLMQEQMMQMQTAQADKMIHTRKASGTVLKTGEPVESVDANLDLLMSVPLELSVEIGRTKKPVKEIVDLAKGSLVVLDRIAGEPVDLYVNGECIARGDVVVVEDNFGIRITEILQDNLDIGV